MFRFEFEFVVSIAGQDAERTTLQWHQDLSAHFLSPHERSEPCKCKIKAIRSSDNDLGTRLHSMRCLLESSHVSGDILGSATLTSTLKTKVGRDHGRAQAFCEAPLFVISLPCAAPVPPLC